MWLKLTKHGLLCGVMTLISYSYSGKLFIDKSKKVYMRRAKENNIDVTALARDLINLHDIELESLPIMYAISGSD